MRVDPSKVVIADPATLGIRQQILRETIALALVRSALLIGTARIGTELAHGCTQDRGTITPSPALTPDRERRGGTAVPGCVAPALDPADSPIWGDFRLGDVPEGDSVAQRSLQISLLYVRAGLWALAGVVLLAAGAVTYCLGGIGFLFGAVLVVLALFPLLYAAYRANDVYKLERQIGAMGSTVADPATGGSVRVGPP